MWYLDAKSEPTPGSNAIPGCLQQRQLSAGSVPDLVSLGFRMREIYKRLYHTRHLCAVRK
jgi:hypothetical protein